MREWLYKIQPAMEVIMLSALIGLMVATIYLVGAHFLRTIALGPATITIILMYTCVIEKYKKNKIRYQSLLYGIGVGTPVIIAFVTNSYLMAVVAGGGVALVALYVSYSPMFGQDWATVHSRSEDK